ncbi:MAG: type VI secretion system tip protein TssI/VgrG [Alphaproteobacteria bacterium]
MADVDFTQTGKFIRIQVSSLGTDKLLLNGVVGQEAISQPFSYQLQMLSTDFAIKPEDVVGKLATLMIARTEDAFRFYSGFITNFVAGAKHPKRPELRCYRAEMVPWFALLKHISTSRIFQQKTVADVIEEVLTEGLNKLVTQREQSKFLDTSRLKKVSYQKLEYCVQYDETNFNFVSRLMEEYGIFYFFEQASDFHRMTLIPSATLLTGNEQDVTFNVNQSKSGGVFAWEHNFTFRTGGYAQKDYNFLTPTAKMLTSEKSNLPIEKAKPTEQFFWAGRYRNQDEGKPLTRVRMEEEETRYHFAKGSSTYVGFLTGVGFSPGTRIKWAKHDLADEKGKIYLLNSVDFTAAEADYTGETLGEIFLQMTKTFGGSTLDQLKSAIGDPSSINVLGLLKQLPGFGVTSLLGLGAASLPWLENIIGNFLDKHLPGPLHIIADLIPHHADPTPYTNNFTCYPDGTPVRPPRLTPKPEIRGPQPALVVGPEGEEIHTDEHGRIRVKFYWDRETDDANNQKLKAGETSCWMRVTQYWAGPTRGSQYVPRVGDEVMVEFLDGDPDRPIVVGSVYNGDNKVPFELTKYKTQSGFKTRSSLKQKGESKDKFHVFRFDDSTGHEQVLLRSQRRHDLRVYGSSYNTIHANRHMLVGFHDQDSDETGGDLNLTVSHNYSIHVKNDCYEWTEGVYDLHVTGKTVFDLEADHSHIVGGVYELNAREIHVEALTKISLMVGGSFVVIDPSGVYITGPVVMINSGGAPVPTSPAPITDPTDATVSDNGDPGYLMKQQQQQQGQSEPKTHMVPVQHSGSVSLNTDGSYQVGPGIKVNAPNPEYASKVINALTTMGQTKSGGAALASLNNSGKSTTIQPLEAPMAGGSSFTSARSKPNAFTGALSDAGATPAGQPALKFSGEPVTDDAGNPVSGTGAGSDAVTLFDPDQWPDPTSRTKAPADVVLFHELTHADHIAHGTRDNTPTHDNYVTREEARTIAAENQYRAERGVGLRRDHGDS